MDTSFCNSTLHGVPQGCVVRPHLLTLLTHDCTATELHSANYIIKFRDDNIGMAQWQWGVCIHRGGQRRQQTWLLGVCYWDQEKSIWEWTWKVTSYRHNPETVQQRFHFLWRRKGQPSSCYSYHILPEDSWAHPLLIRQCIMWELQQNWTKVSPAFCNDSREDHT